MRGGEQKGTELKGHMQKSGVHLGLMGHPGINPGKEEWHLGVGRPEAELGLSQVHP